MNNTKTHTGTISINTKGKGFVRLDARAKLGREADVPIQPEDIGEALQGDTVEISLYTGYRGLEHGVVEKVIEHKKTSFVGSLVNDPLNSNILYLEPDDKRSNLVIEILKSEIDPEIASQLSPKVKVQAVLEKWLRLPHHVSYEAREEKRNRDRATDSSSSSGSSSGSSTNTGTNEKTDSNKNIISNGTNGYLDLSIIRIASGKIIRVIGEKGQNNTEMEAIVLERGFDVTFPEEVIKEAEIAEKEYSKITDEELAKRRDMRGVFTCTIDPVDAKDFDDALSIREATPEHKTAHPEAYYEIGVHIADVSHFVRPNTKLDAEAKKRSFSVYLVDRTIPMLPSILSNGACSLNPHEDRFAYSAIFLIKKNGEIVDKWFGKTIIHSDKRFTYENAQEVLTAHESIAKDQNAIDALPWRDESNKELPFTKELLEFNRIAKIYLKQKQENGAIDFETTEIKFKLDENGYPVGVYKKDRIDTHKLVEEFMLLANREVSKFVSEKNKVGSQERPGVYRVHDRPDPDRIKELGLYVRALGFDFPIDEKNANKITPKHIQALLREVEGKPEEPMIKVSTLRSMAKAIYDTHDKGHFGLAYDHYTHFTSPIRRYPDLMVHRILSLVLAGSTVSTQDSAGYTTICEHASKREVEAADAERASVKYKQVEYMMKKIGQEFEVTISGISDFGIFVQEPEALAEGLIRIRDLKPDDFYTVDSKNFKVIGEKTKTEFHIGNKLKVKLDSADLENKMLNFSIIA